MSATISVEQWEKLDTAYKSMTGSMLEFCKLVKGETYISKQKDIAMRYGVPVAHRVILHLHPRRPRPQGRELSAIWLCWERVRQGPSEGVAFALLTKNDQSLLFGSSETLGSSASTVSTGRFFTPISSLVVWSSEAVSNLVSFTFGGLGIQGIRYCPTFA